MNKHAYLIMAHNELYILERLLKLIDDNKNDIYLHIDKKVKNFNYEYFKKIVKKSNLYFVNSMDVRWGTFSQITCELELLKEATKNKYSYYHLLSGVDLPLKPQNEIYDFFEKRQGYEFIAMTDTDCKERIKYYHNFVKNIRNNKISKILHFLSLKIQKKLKIDRLKNTNLVIKKGANWFSITDDLARYVLSQNEFIHKHFKKSICADELFLQTLVYNSKFKDKIYNENHGEHENIMRLIDWQRGDPYTFTIKDKEMLLNSKMFWARKFSTKEERNKKIVDYIYNKLNK